MNKDTETQTARIATAMREYLNRQRDVRGATPDDDEIRRNVTATGIEWTEAHDRALALARIGMPGQLVRVS